MKVLFALNNESSSQSIIQQYQQTYKDIITSKNVYFFNAIIKELARDKTYDAVVIGEDLEPVSNNNYDQMDKFLLEKLDDISDEASRATGEDIPIIFICSDRRTKSDQLLRQLFSMSIYNALVASDRNVPEVCRLINRPRNKKEAKKYYQLEADESTYQPATDELVSEDQIKNILNYYSQLGGNEAKYGPTFERIAQQYDDSQLRLIVKFLPMRVKAVLETSSPKYQQLMTGGTVLSNGAYSEYSQQDARKPQSLAFFEKDLQGSKLESPVVIPSAMDFSNAVQTAPSTQNQYNMQQANMGMNTDAGMNANMGMYTDAGMNANMGMYTDAGMNAQQNAYQQSYSQSYQQTNQQPYQQAYQQTNQQPYQQAYQQTNQQSYQEPYQQQSFTSQEITTQQQEAMNYGNGVQYGMQNQNPYQDPFAQPDMQTMQDPFAVQPTEQSAQNPFAVDMNQSANQNINQNVQTMQDPFAVQPVEQPVQDPFAVDMNQNVQTMQDPFAVQPTEQPAQDPFAQTDEQANTQPVPASNEQIDGELQAVINGQVVEQPHETNITQNNNMQSASNIENKNHIENEERIENSVIENESHVENSNTENEEHVENSKIENEGHVEKSVATENVEEIPTEHKRGRGRPRKNPLPDAQETQQQKRGRGRPRKVKPEEENTLDEGIASNNETNSDFNKETDNEFNNEIDNLVDDSDLLDNSEEELNSNQGQELHSTQAITRSEQSQSENATRQMQQPTNAIDAQELLDEVDFDAFDFGEEADSKKKVNKLNNAPMQGQTSAQSTTSTAQTSAQSITPTVQTSAQSTTPTVQTSAQSTTPIAQTSTQSTTTAPAQALMYATTPSLTQSTAQFQPSTQLDTQSSMQAPMQQDPYMMDYNAFEYDGMIDNTTFRASDYQPYERNRPKQDIQFDQYQNVISSADYQDYYGNDLTENNYYYDNKQAPTVGNGKIVSFVGTSKNGTSFLVNNLGLLLSQGGIKTAIVDATKNKNSYYMFTNNDQQLSKVAANSLKKLAEGEVQGLSINPSLTLFTGLPGDIDELYLNIDNIVNLLSMSFDVILIDCDYNTNERYFGRSNEIYLVQSMDAFTIQPLTKFLSDLKIKGILDEKKLRIVVNKYIKMKKLTYKMIVGGMSKYNEPSMTLQRDLFNPNTIKYILVPFDEETYRAYLEEIATCTLTLDNYSDECLRALEQLKGMVYPLIAGTGRTDKKHKRTSFSGNKKGKNRSTNYTKQQSLPKGQRQFSNNTNNTLNKMRNY